MFKAAWGVIGLVSMIECGSAGGATGPAGPAGPVGPEGPAGVAGPAGPAGPAGMTGPQGAPGMTGPQGMIGMTGPQGMIGMTGPQGVAGPAGPAGPEGPEGPEGMEGQPGPGEVVSLNHQPPQLPTRLATPSNGAPTFLGSSATFAFGTSSLATVSATVAFGSEPGGSFAFSICTRRGTAAPVMVALANQPLVPLQFYDKDRVHIRVSGTVTASSLGSAGNTQVGVCVRSQEPSTSYDHYGVNGSVVFVE